MEIKRKIKKQIMKKLSLQELEINIVNWAMDRDLIKSDNAPKQRLKLIEEVGETAGCILKGDIDGIKDGLGDCFVVLVILAHQTNYKLHLNSFLRWSDDTYSSSPGVLLHEIIHGSFHGLLQPMCTLHYLAELLGYDLTDCANGAWNEIKDRRGVTLNGTFLKNE